MSKDHVIKIGRHRLKLQYPPLVWLALTIAVFLISIGAIYTGYESVRHLALDLGGNQTDGIVIDQVLHEHDDHIEHHITYQFDDTTASQTVTEAFYNSLNIGESVTVTYIPGQPSLNRIESIFGERLYLLGATIALLIAFLWLVRWTTPQRLPSP